MSYPITDILTWADAAQPLAFNGERKKQAQTGDAIDLDLHMKIYVEKKSLEWQYAQNPTDTDNILFGQGNYVYALLFPYLFQAQMATGGSGQVVTPGSNPFAIPDPLDWEVGATASATAPLKDGDSAVSLDGTNGMPNLIGFNVEFTRNGVTQFTTIPPDGVSSYYSWNRTTGVFTLLNGAAQLTEQFRIFPSR